MKNFFKILVLFLTVFITPLALFASNAIEVLGFDAQSYFATLSAFVALVLAATQMLKKAINIDGGYAKILSWIVSILLGFIGWYFKLGIFEDLQWYWAIIYGIAGGLMANGIFNIGVVDAILSLIPKKTKLKK